MKKIILMLKYFAYYIIGLVSFSTIAFITQRITISLLLESAIYPNQDLNNLLTYILAYGPYYLIIYSILYFILILCVRKYDRHSVKKLNEKLEKLKVNNFGGAENGER